MEPADEPNDSGSGWLGVDRFDVQLAIVFGVLSAVGWAVITGADSTPAGRLGFAAVGAPIGAVFGLRMGSSYRDSGPTGRAFLHWTAYVMAVLVVAAVVGGGHPSVDTLLAASIAVPVGVLVGRNLVGARGDRRLGAGMTPLVIAAVGLLIIIERDGGGTQIVAVVGLGISLVAAVSLDLISQRSRLASGDLQPSLTRVRPSGWRLWFRIAGVLVCLMGAVAAMSPVEVDDRPCGSLSEALRLPEESECAGEARFQAFGGWVLAIGAAALLIGAIRGRIPTSKDGPGEVAKPAATEPPRAAQPGPLSADPSEDVDRWPGILVIAAFLFVVGAQIVRVSGVVSDRIGLVITSIGLAAVAALLVLAAVTRSKRSR